MNIKVIPGHAGYYASDCGRIFSDRGNTIMHELKQRIQQNGYMKVKIHGKSHSTHRLIARTWCDGYSDGLCVNHKDSNKLNNNSSNLEWVTHKQNMAHSVATGMRSGRPHGTGCGRPVWRLIDGQEKIISPSICQASRDIGIPSARGAPHIHGAIKGKYPTAYKFKWGYV
jgi:hypothetical protein